jgi:hypothetical protein
MGMNVEKAKVMRISKLKSPAQDMIKKTSWTIWNTSATWVVL